MKAPIALVIVLHAVVVHCMKMVSKRGSGKSPHLLNVNHPNILLISL